MIGHHPELWWFKLAKRLLPDRCREVPEATDPGRVLLRQLAIVKEHCYLQQFASGENCDYHHSHPWSLGTIAIGVSGAVGEERLAGPNRIRRYYAPYFRYMPPEFIHNTFAPSAGHTSIFIGLGRKTDDKHYFSIASKKHWRDHIKKLVKRI